MALNFAESWKQWAVIQTVRYTSYPGLIKCVTLIVRVNTQHRIQTFTENIGDMCKFCLACRWANRVLEEFFMQGDQERAQGLPVSPLMDRSTTSLAISQINFIEFVVAPLFHQVCQQLPPDQNLGQPSGTSCACYQSGKGRLALAYCLWMCAHGGLACERRHACMHVRARCEGSKRMLGGGNAAHIYG